MDQAAHTSQGSKVEKQNNSLYTGINSGDTEYLVSPYFVPPFENLQNNSVKLATLLYIRNVKGEYLLMERAKEPNKGLLSPPGGKLITEKAESPFGCAVREFHEECGIKTKTTDWTLTGIITEKDYPNIGNIMIFLMSYKNFVNELPGDSVEGRFHFFHPDNFCEINIPETDKLFIWEFVLQDAKQPFCLHIDCSQTPYKGKLET